MDDHSVAGPARTICVNSEFLPRPEHVADHCEVAGREGVNREYTIPKYAHLVVQDGEWVASGESLTDAIKNAVALSPAQPDWVAFGNWDPA